MVLPSRRVATRPAPRRTERCWLMLGTWHPTRLDRSLTESSPAASDSRTHSRFGSASARPTAAYRCRSGSLEVGLLITWAVSHWLRKRASTLRLDRPGLRPAGAAGP